MERIGLERIGFTRGVALFALMLSPIASAGTPNCPEAGTALSEVKISETAGGFVGVLDSFDNFGRAVASLGDLDGDGVPDFAIGAPGDDDGGASRGAVWILFLQSDGTVRAQQKISSTEGEFGGNLDDSDNFGRAVTSLGDLDGDGISDLVVGASGDDDGADSAGAVWVLFLNADGTVKTEQKISATQGGFGGLLEAGDIFGAAVASPGDLDDDGVSDLAVGAILDDDGGFSAGAVWILFLNADGTVRAEQKISETEGGFAGLLDNGDNFGGAIAPLADLDADGVPDLAVGVRFEDDGEVCPGGVDRGAVWILFLNADGTVKAEQKISATEGDFDGLLEPQDQFGASVALLGDLDKDGVSDLAVGAILDDDGGQDRGTVWVLFLKTDGTVKAARKLSDTVGGFAGVLDNQDNFGASVVSLGDLDADGRMEFAVGADLDDDGDFGAGAVWVLSLGDCVSGPFITTQPARFALLPVGGGVAQFAITATGDPTLTYRWRRDNADLVNAGPFSGADTPTLTITTSSNEDFGVYDCVVTNPFGSVTSQPSVLAIRQSCDTDIDSDGFTGFADLNALLSEFNSACPP